MEPLCKNCKHWGEDRHTLASTPQKECRNRDAIYEDDYRRDGDPSSSLIYQYYEGGQFWTGPDFGCVQFSPLLPTA